MSCWIWEYKWTFSERFVRRDDALALVRAWLRQAIKEVPVIEYGGLSDYPSAAWKGYARMMSDNAQVIQQARRFTGIVTLAEELEPNDVTVEFVRMGK
jgi:hypothetical protein